MIPMQHSCIFKSRWMALLWAAGIIWFALDFAGPGDVPAGNTTAEAKPTDITGAPVDDKDMKKLEGILKDM
jgi:hypothetical protein